MLTSEDAVAWSAATSHTSDTLYAVAFGDGVFVLVGANGTVGRATDPQLWATSRELVTTLSDIVFTDNQFVVVGIGGAVFTSPNGATFTGQNSQTDLDLRAITFGNATFVAVGLEGIVRTSADAVIWLK